MREAHFSWGEARYFDLWTIVHILSAVTIGMIISLGDFSSLMGYVVAILLIIGWEVIEYLVYIVSKGKRMFEAIENRLLDILLGVGIFSLAYHNTIMLDFEKKILLLVPVLFLNILFAFFGWLHYHQAHVE